jgi:hypothetical protein
MFGDKAIVYGVHLHLLCDDTLQVFLGVNICPEGSADIARSKPVPSAYHKPNNITDLNTIAKIGREFVCGVQELLGEQKYAGIEGVPVIQVLADVPDAAGAIYNNISCFSKIVPLCWGKVNTQGLGNARAL